MNLKKIKITPTLIILLFLFSNSSFAQSIEEGIKFIDNHKYNAAAEVFNKLLETNKTAVNYYYAGKISAILNKTEDAENLFKAGFAVDKDNFYNQVGLGFVALLKNDTANARSIFGKIIEEDEFDTPGLLLEIADSYLMANSSDNSYPISLLTKYKSMKNYKKDANVLVKLGLLNLNGYSASIAIEHFKNATYIDKNLKTPYIGIARIYQKIKSYQDAESNLEEAKKIDSTFAPLHLEYSEFYATTKQYEKAVVSYKKYIEYSELTNDKQAKYATLLFLASNYEGAVAEILKIKNTDKFDKQLSHILAYCYYFLNNFNDGIPAFNEYFGKIESVDISASDYEFLGKLNVLANNDSAVVDNYTKCIQLDSSKASLYGDIAGLYFKQKDWANTAKYFQLKLQNVGKLSLKEYFDLGRCYMITKEYSLADTVYGMVIEAKSDLALGYLMRARAKSSIDTTSELGLAKPFYEKFIELAVTSATPEKYTPDLIEAYSYLGYFYYIKKEDPAYLTTWNEAFKLNWGKVLELDPANVQAIEALKTVK
ncbi:MAG: hypothetical protein V1773_04730 [bacterium]